MEKIIELWQRGLIDEDVAMYIIAMTFNAEHGLPTYRFKWDEEGLWYSQSSTLVRQRWRGTQILSIQGGLSFPTNRQGGGFLVELSNEY